MTIHDAAPSAARPQDGQAGPTDVLIVGAGFAGLYMLHAIRTLGLSAVLLEAGDGVGGTWHHNRYPGARCDVDSIDYSYSFDPAIRAEWTWSERYPSAPEIRRYLEFVADRLGLRRDIRLSTRVRAAEFDEHAESWSVTADDGRTWRARWLVFATGSLSQANAPDFPGASEYRGRLLHTADWPRDADLRGRRVGVIGTGSSGVQAIPVLAEEAEHLVVFQRTPGFVVPARNHPLSPDETAAIEADYATRRQALRESFGGWHLPPSSGPAADVPHGERLAELERRWSIGGLCLQSAFSDVMTDPAANEQVARFVRDRIRDTVHDPSTAETLCPTGYPLGAKRLCVGTDYYETYNRGNVDLVDLRATPLETFTPGGIRTSAQEYALDAVVLATGFDAMTGALDRIDIRGRGGRRLRDEWAAGPRSYLGLSVAGFPNMFVLAGPGSPSVMSNVVVSIEQHVEWVRDLLAHLADTGTGTVEATAEAQDRWVELGNQIASATLYPSADSWYMGANVPGKPRVFMPFLGGVGTYRGICDGVAADGYKGFTLG
ncbi:flavin-containing monooxygenase [Tomitella fengzijianii]|uniref:NAD(P)/FAD-dependent oxidoreductase n=1 Tax=Tomitella fengzijianii TaxID=2597660 RepID=A0A516X5V9_9ACTN|nr:NAD(P)/FAD-dependent oxidoreductase [Tomitella fengzijianii]QDQ98430.1 NAD(P)/FAD-dependent oxidoreductase [Tomitella fengzijianii]